MDRKRDGARPCRRAFPHEGSCRSRGRVRVHRRFLPGPLFRHGGPSRHARRRNEPHEHLHRRACHTGVRRLPERTFREPERRHRARQPQQRRALRAHDSGHLRGERRARIRVPAHFPCSHAFLGRARFGLLGRRMRDGESQPRRLQRLQGLWTRRLPDNERGRSRHLGSDRGHRYLLRGEVRRLRRCACKRRRHLNRRRGARALL